MTTQTKTKHNTRKLLLKGKSKRDIKELITPLLTPNPPAGSTVPPFTAFLHLRRNVLVVTVPLHRVPEKVVQFDSAPERFLLDTTKFTRKPFHLEFKYPEGLKVEAESAEAKIENGIFVATIPLLAVPPTLQHKDGMEVVGDAPSRKRKRTGDAGNQQNGAEAKSAASSANGDASQKKEKKKQPKKKKQKKDPNAQKGSSEKQIDARAVDVDKAMGLIDEVNSKEEAQITEKLVKEKEKKAAINAKQREKREKKQKKKEMINRLADEVKKEKQQAQRENQPVKKATPRRVSFGQPSKKESTSNGTAPSAVKKSALKKPQPAAKKAAASKKKSE